MKAKLVKQMQNYVAETSVGASALRNQGGSGLVSKARKYFKTLDLSKIPTKKVRFDSWLKRRTEKLRCKFPSGARKFGTARKALNLFLRSATYNVVLNGAYRLDRLLPVLEVPLDSYVANHLKTRVTSLPDTWVGLKFVSRNKHGEYQNAAGSLAKSWGVHRVDLDVFFYREEAGAA
jgi:hypothetical protein